MSSAIILTPPASGQIWPGQGGVYICTMPALFTAPARHIIGGLEDSPTKLVYGPYGKDVPGASCHVDGRANTAALTAAGDEYEAAKWASEYEAEGHKDYHLASRLDMLMAYICAAKHFKKSDVYSTSTQHSRGNAFVQDFEDGDSYWNYKDCERRVRAFRWISLNP